VVLGETQEWERQVALTCFRENDKIRTLCLSKVGDMSIDLPNANVIIQVSSHFGSRQQEAQRLGRILRPKKDQCNDGSFHAYFYTVVSNGTKEVEVSEKRRGYLVGQGCSIQIVTNLLERAASRPLAHNFSYDSPGKDAQLLDDIVNGEVGQRPEPGQEQFSLPATAHASMPPTKLPQYSSSTMDWCRGD